MNPDLYTIVVNNMGRHTYLRHVVHQKCQQHKYNEAVVKIVTRKLMAATLSVNKENRTTL